MEEQNKEEIEKFNLFQKEILKEHEFLKKIKDIFELQNMEKFHDILILQKHQYIEQVEKEVLFILKKLYSEKIINHRRFNALYQLGKDHFKALFNDDFEEITNEWEYFKDLKNINNIEDDEILNSYYLTDFRKHCHNHEGLAIHKCGHAEKGKFIKISVKNNSRFRNSKEFKYIICEECKKVFLKDLFNNYCTYCKENYLCSILGPTESKENYLVTYSSPHCESFINKIIPCKLCKEKLHLFINDKKIKCIKCNYVIDLNNNKNEFQWQCTKCNKYFKSNVKIYNPSESYILTKILKKALLLKIKARPQYMNCCNIDINNSPFFHKKECKGILYLCNVENYFLKNKRWVIVCEKCHAINNCKNFIWTCPKCGKRSRESNYEKEEMIKSPQRKVSSSHNNINKIDDENDLNNNDPKINIFQKYLSNFIIKKPSLSTCSKDDNNKRGKKEYENSKNIYLNKDEIERYNEDEFNKDNDLIKVNIKFYDKQNANGSNSNYIVRGSKRYNNKRNNQIISNINNNNSINYINKMKNSGEKYINKNNLNFVEEIQNNNNDKKKIEKTIPFDKIYIKKKNSIMFSTAKEDENREHKIKAQRGDNCKSNSILDEKGDGLNEIYCINYFSQNNYEENKNNINTNKNLIFSLPNKKNMPVRLNYNNEKNNNISNYNKNRQNFKKSLILEKSNNKIKQVYLKNDEELTERNKCIIFNSVDEKILNVDGRISKETTAHGSKGSIASSSKDKNNANNNNNIYIKKLDNNISNNNVKDIDYFYSTTNNFNFKNKRKYYIQEKGKENDNIKNLKNNMQNSTFGNNFKNCKTILELNDLESNNDNDAYIDRKYLDKPDDIIDASALNYSEDIPVYDSKLKQNRELYNNIQDGIKKILEKGRLPQFNIDNYTIGKKIGDGAFGVLFSVVNNKTKKKYALKKLTAHDFKLLEEFQREFEIAYKIEHDNILSLYGICIRVYDSTTFALFVLMDLAECDWEVEINKRFKEKKFYKEEELILILKQLTNALVYLQNKQIAHRDIKPENILLFHDNDKITYKICDFGEAKEKIKVNSRHKSIRGTDFYMSPILFKGLTQEEKFVRDNPYKSDVFSLGFCMIIACVLDFNFINKIRNIEEQTKIDKLIRESLENRYSFKFIHVLLKMIVYYEKERIDFLGLEKLINDEL